MSMTANAATKPAGSGIVSGAGKNPHANIPLPADSREDFAACAALVSLQGLRAHVRRRAETAGDNDTDRFYVIAAELSHAIDIVEGLRRELEAQSETSR